MHPSRLEQYLDQLEQPLAALSREARQEWREEARQHLLCLVAAHEELGSSPEEAMEAALRQFGDPAHIGRNMRTATRRTAGLLPTAEVYKGLAAMFGNVGMFGALMRLPGAYDHLPAIGVALGIAYSAAGAVFGRTARGLAPAPAAMVSLWSGCYTALPYLTLLAVFSAGSGVHLVTAAGAVLGGAASTGGLLLGALSTYRSRRRQQEPPPPALPLEATGS